MTSIWYVIVDKNGNDLCDALYEEYGDDLESLEEAEKALQELLYWGEIYEDDGWHVERREWTYSL